MAVERKPVTKKPGWLMGVIFPTLAGIPLGVFLQDTPVTAWYTLAGWQFLFAIALVLERAPVYGASSIPQSRRLCELYGLKWLGMTAITFITHLQTDLLLAQQVLAINLVMTYGFSIAAGPIRLMNANDNEMILVPINSLITAWAATILYLTSTSVEA